MTSLKVQEYVDADINNAGKHNLHDVLIKITNDLGTREQNV